VAAGTGAIVEIVLEGHADHRGERVGCRLGELIGALLRHCVICAQHENTGRNRPDRHRTSHSSLRAKRRIKSEPPESPRELSTENTSPTSCNSVSNIDETLPFSVAAF